MNVASSLRGKHVIVTGGGHGIGAAISWELASHGASLTLMGRNIGLLEGQAARLRTELGAEAVSIHCDITEAASVQQAFPKARETFGNPYALVNNAGQAAGAAFLATDLELWNRMISVNLTGAYLCTREVLPDMLRTHCGRIINISSTAGLKGYSHVAAYCASKHGLIGLTRSLAAEVAQSGVTVNAICPGYTEGDMTDRTIEELSVNSGRSEQEARDMIIRSIPRKELIQPAEIADAVTWLCGDAATAITGQAIAVAGGEVV
jgi:NAD(P)-dependent dehydrogenase (short-subunit alcohol dehydrogenase family)